MADRLASVEEIQSLVTECDECGGTLDYGENTQGAGWFRCDNPACKDVGRKFQIPSQAPDLPDVLEDIRATLVDSQDYRALLGAAHARLNEVSAELDALKEQHRRVIVMLLGELDRERWGTTDEGPTEAERRERARTMSLEQFVQHALICAPAGKCLCGFEEASNAPPPTSAPPR